MERGRAAGESVTELGERRGGQGQRSGACVDVGGTLTAEGPLRA